MSSLHGSGFLACFDVSRNAQAICIFWSSASCTPQVRLDGCGHCFVDHGEMEMRGQLLQAGRPREGRNAQVERERFPRGSSRVQKLTNSNARIVLMAGNVWMNRDRGRIYQEACLSKERADWLRIKKNPMSMKDGANLGSPYISRQTIISETILDGPCVQET
ncbi:hypothetical protein BD289DRAFT_10302 [Coniella lustricola]|uniref:Uncharacterized protein n=1 Tax=Coniella lustricola TaxID=2025994 RepID=A0A2T3A4K1_9PEZI|nr:hypothetical protein BD289DRAFT_10302 [Coniella lustricola]